MRVSSQRSPSAPKCGTPLFPRQPSTSPIPPLPSPYLPGRTDAQLEPSDPFYRLVPVGHSGHCDISTPIYGQRHVWWVTVDTVTSAPPYTGRDMFGGHSGPSDISTPIYGQGHAWRVTMAMVTSAPPGRGILSLLPTPSEVGGTHATGAAGPVASAQPNALPSHLFRGAPPHVPMPHTVPTSP